MAKPQRLWLFFVLTIPSIIPIALHAYLGSFTRLMADDYCTLYFTNRLGILRTAWYWYLNFAGVYARSLINKVLLLVGPHNISTIVPSVLLLWVAITAWVLYLLLEKEISSRYRLWFSLAWSITFIYIVLLLSPQPTQSLYWWGGFSAYTAPLILGTFYLGAFLFMIRKEWNKTAFTLWNIASFLMTFGLGGISESFSPTLIVILALSVSWGLVTKKLATGNPAVWFLGAGLLGSILATITMISAPGNAIRMSYFPSNSGIIGIVQISVNGYFYFLATLLSEPQKLTGILGVFLGSMLLGTNSSNANLPKNWTPLAILALSIFLAYLCFPPAVYATSEPPPNRVLVISSFMLAVGLFASGYMSGKSLALRLPANFIQILTGSLLLITTVLASFSTWVTSQTLYESRSIYIEFANL